MRNLRFCSLRAILLKVGMLALVASSAFSQASSPPEFEVAAVHLVKHEAGTGFLVPSIRRNAGRIDYSNVTLGELVLRAYDLPDYRVIWPDRLREAMGALYDISAVIPAGATSSQLGPMLQRLLASRLAFTVHWEKRNLPSYVLTVAATGLKMPRSKFDPSSVPGDPTDEAQREKNPYTIYQGDAEERITGVITIAQLARLLGRQGGRPIIDETALQGYFDINFTWGKPRDPLPFALPPGPDGASTPAGPPGKAAPLPPALEKQLGLKAEPRNISMDVLVIDGVNITPSAN